MRCGAVVPGRVPLSDLVDPLAKMGQVLFTPPNVKGWRTGTDWLNSATLLARNNFAETVAMGEWSKQGVARPRERPRSSSLPSRPRRRSRTSRRPRRRRPRTRTRSPLIYAVKPKNIPAVVKQMGELLYGEHVTSAQVAKIEKFLNEPGPPPGQAAARAEGFAHAGRSAGARRFRPRSNRRS